MGVGSTRYISDYSGNQITAKQLSKMIQNHPAYQKGLRVKLFVGNVGVGYESGFAQHLADYLQTIVYAPNGELWINPKGKVIIAYPRP